MRLILGLTGMSLLHILGWIVLGEVVAEHLRIFSAPPGFGIQVRLLGQLWGVLALLWAGAFAVSYSVRDPRPLSRSAGATVAQLACVLVVTPLLMVALDPAFALSSASISAGAAFAMAASSIPAKRRCVHFAVMTATAILSVHIAVKLTMLPDHWIEVVSVGVGSGAAVIATVEWGWPARHVNEPRPLRPR